MPVVTCLACGRPFEGKTKRACFCSTACWNETQRLRTQKHEAWLPRRCPTCRAQFEPAHHRQLCCSPRCKRLRHNARQVTQRAAQKEATVPLQGCVVCSAMFRPRNVAVRCCSVGCSAVYNRGLNADWERRHRRPRWYPGRGRKAPENDQDEPSRQPKGLQAAQG